MRRLKGEEGGVTTDGREREKQREGRRNGKEMGRRGKDAKVGSRDEGKERVDLAREAHTLASTCRSFGLPDVAEKLNCIESHAKADGIAGEPPCVNEVGSQLQAGLRELEQVVAGLQAG